MPQITPMESAMLDAAEKTAHATSAPNHDEVSAARRAAVSATQAVGGWADLVARYERAKAVSDAAAAKEMDDDNCYEDHRPIHAAYCDAREALFHATASDWGGIAIKAEALLNTWGDDPDERWAKTVKGLINAANAMQSDGADPVLAMMAFAAVEQMRYFLLHDSGGYRAWGACPGQVSELAFQAEGLASDCRHMAYAVRGARALCGAAFDALWFKNLPPELGGRQSAPVPCPVNLAGDRWSRAIRDHDEYDGAREPEINAKAEEAFARLCAAEEEAQAAVPTSRGGVAFQLLCAIGEIEVVENGISVAVKEEAGNKIRQAVVNAIRVLGLPFDDRAARYFLSPDLAESMGTGANLPGPSQ